MWQKAALVLLALILLVASTMYGIGRWYVARHSDTPMTWGVSFVPSYAEYLELDPQETMQAIIDDLDITRFRLVSHWSSIEKEQGSYDFSQLDWQFEKVKQAEGQVSLSLGLRQPRWPECHMPEWAHDLPESQWYPELKQFMTAVIERYRDHPSLVSYQLENEFFINVFGECPRANRERLVDEFDLVKQLDPNTPVIITRSNNLAPSWPVRQPHADIYGGTIYKRAWYQDYGRRYIYNPLPSWYYAFIAGVTELATGKPFFVHELQAEPWIPDNFELPTMPTSEQDKTMSPDTLRFILDFAKSTGTKTIDLWGVEWWYWRKANGDPTFWDIVRQETAP